MWAEETKTVVGSAVVEAQQAPPAPEPEAPGMAAWPAGCCDKSTFTTAAVGNAHDAAVDWMSSRRTSICSAVSARLASWKRDIRGTARECPSTAHIPNLRLLTVLCRSAHEDANEQRECVILVVRGPNYGQRETVASRSDMASATKVRIEGEADSFVGRAA